MTRPLLVRLATFGLVLVLASLCTYWVLIFTSGREPLEPLATTPAGDSTARTQAIDVSSLARLFGDGSGATRDDLALIGVIAQGTRGHGVALVSIERQPAVAVQAGETLPDGTALIEVRPESIVVRRNGITREIALPAPPASDALQPVR